MRKIAILMFALAASFAGNSQVKTPKPSPSGIVTQTVGLTDISVSYSRPSVRGREIFGKLQAYGELWRTGANKNTVITFSDPVVIEGKPVAAGSYALYTKPGKEAWELIFYTDTENWGTPKEWNESKIAVSTTVKSSKLSDLVETLTISFDNLTNNSGLLSIKWEHTAVSVKIEVPTKEKASKSIESVMGGPSASDYHSAAAFYYEEGKDLNKAKEWIDKSVALNGKAFWAIRMQSLIYAKLGDKKGAIAAAKKSFSVAEAVGNTHYMKLNTESLKEWGAK